MNDRRYIGRLHCVYCGSLSKPITHILFNREPEDIQKERLEFEDYHDSHCGKKSVGLVLEFEKKEEEK